jgi:hypothetical protein
MPSTIPGPYSRSQFFSASGSFVVPGGVTAVNITMIGGGGGGGGGHATVGGGGGGGSAMAVLEVPMTVTPGSTLTVTVGAAGGGGSAAADGSEGGVS